MPANDYRQMAQEISDEDMKRVEAEMERVATQQVKGSLYQQADTELFPEQVQNGYGAQSDGEINSVVLNALKRGSGSFEDIISALNLPMDEEAAQTLLQSLQGAQDNTTQSQLINDAMGYAQGDPKAILQILNQLTAAKQKD